MNVWTGHESHCAHVTIQTEKQANGYPFTLYEYQLCILISRSKQTVNRSPTIITNTTTTGTKTDCHPLVAATVIAVNSVNTATANDILTSAPIARPNTTPDVTQAATDTILLLPLMLLPSQYY
jgi:hypothetical protein